jgi:hypothetical protein
VHGVGHDGLARAEYAGGELEGHEHHVRHEADDRDAKRCAMS